MKQKHSVLKNM